LYAANQAGTGSINVFNSSFAPVSLGAGAFATPAAISALGLVPFNVQDIGNVYVTYAPSGLAAQRGATPGMGAVAVFTESGTLLQTIIGGQLAAPWGVALAPASFGEFGGDLLVGNFSFVESEINAFNPTTGRSRARSQSTPAAAILRVAFGRFNSGSAA
jgi:TIGR03118 family protein